MIPHASPRAQTLALRAELDAALARVLEGGRYILGPEVEAFEREFAEWNSVPHGVGTGSGTDALHLALRACGIGRGDEVIVPSFTAVATVAAIGQAGAVPVFADIDPATCTIDPERAARAVTPRTRALLPVHLYGRPADMEPLRELAARRGLRVIEDCAQAAGATYRGRRVGGLGDAGCFSFYPTKNLGALGDGGMILTRDAGVAERARRMRQYGWDAMDGRRESLIPGFNSRLDELQAAILRVKLRRLEAGNAARGRIAALYTAALAGSSVSVPAEVPAGDLHAFHLYVVRTPERDALREFLRERGVDSGVHYPVPVHLQEAYRGRCPGADSLPETERAAREVLSLPMYPELAPEQVGAVAEALRAFASRA